MNRVIHQIATFLLLTCLVLLSHNATAQAFSGEITLSTTNPAMRDESVVRWITSGGNHKLILNGTANDKAYLLTVLLLKSDNNVRILTEIDGQKAMFVTPSNEVKPALPPLGSAIVTVDGGATSIAGYDCKKYTVESEEGSAIVFVTNEVNLNLSDFPAFIQKNGIFATLAANNIMGLPLSIISRGADGKLLFSQTITGVKPGPVPASEFSYEGYGDAATIMQKSLQVK